MHEKQGLWLPEFHPRRFRRPKQILQADKALCVAAAGCNSFRVAKKAGQSASSLERLQNA